MTTPGDRVRGLIGEAIDGVEVAFLICYEEMSGSLRAQEASRTLRGVAAGLRIALRDIGEAPDGD